MINGMEGSPSVLSKFFKKEVSNCRGMCSATSKERTFGIGRWWFWNSHFIRCLTPSLMFIRLSHWMMMFNNPFFDVKTNCFPPHDSKLSETGPVPACSKIQVATQVGLELNRNTQSTTTTTSERKKIIISHLTRFQPTPGSPGLQTTALRDLPSCWVSIKATGTETRRTKVSDIKAQATSKITDAGSLVFCGWKYGRLQTGEKWPHFFSSDDMIYYYYYIDINGLYVCRPYKSILIAKTSCWWYTFITHQASSDLKKVTKASANGLGKKKLTSWNPFIL